MHGELEIQKFYEFVPLSETGTKNLYYAKKSVQSKGTISQEDFNKIAKMSKDNGIVPLDITEEEKQIVIDEIDINVELP